MILKKSVEKAKKKMLACIFILLLSLCIYMTSYAFNENIDIYEIKNDYLTRINPETTLQDLRNNLENQEIIALNANGEEIQPTDLLGSGMTARVNGEEIILSVIGDVDGNGKISVTDASKINLHKNNLKMLEDNFAISADMNNDGKVSITDLVQINQVVVGLRDIVAPNSFEPVVEIDQDKITISGETLDELSGVKEYWFKIDDEDWVQNEDKLSGTYVFENIDNYKKHNVFMKVVDKSGNKKKTIKIETSETKGKLRIIREKTEWTNRYVEIYFDLESNVDDAQKYISIDGGKTFERYTGPVRITKNTKIVGKLESDKYGVIAQDEIEITNIDTLPPKEFVPEISTNINAVTVHANTDDADVTSESGKSGIKNYTYKITKDDFEITQTTASSRYTFEGLPYSGEYTVEITVTDNAKNKRVVTTTVELNMDYVVTFNANGGNLDSERETGPLGTEIELRKPTKEGYIFDGWYDNENFEGYPYMSGTKLIISEDKTYYAKWKGRQSIVEYEYNGATDENAKLGKTVIYGDEYGELPSPKKTYKIKYVPNDGTENKVVQVEYEFKGWYSEETFENKVTESTIVQTDAKHTLYAKWEEKTTELPNVQEKTGHTFDGWYENSDFTGDKYEVGDAYLPTKDITLYAKWLGNDYVVTYEYNGATGGNSMSGKDVTYGESYGELPNPEKIYTITYNTNFETTLEPAVIEYTFNNWYKEEAFTNEITESTIVNTDNDHTIYTKWTGDTVELPEITRFGHTFDGWYENSDFTGDKYEAGGTYVATKDVTLYAKWILDTSTLTIDLDGGDYLGQITLEQGVSTTTQIQAPTKEGYTFIRWDVTKGNGTLQDNTFTFGTEDTTIKAIWETNEYTISFNANGGSVTPTSITKKYGEEITLPIPTRDGYTFIGWYDNEYFNGTVLDKVKIKGDKTYYAKWDAKSYVITYNYKGATGNNAKTSKVVEYGAKYGTLEQPVQEYKATFIYNDGRANTEQTETYTFDGWYLEADYQTKVDENSIVAIDENHTLYAKWTASSVTTPEVGSRTGYDFIGWYENSNFSGTKYTEKQTLATTKDITMYAKWKGQDFDVDYEYNGATSGNTEGGKTVTFGEEYGTLPNPKKEYTITYNLNTGAQSQTGKSTYTFDSWYKETAFTNAVNSSTIVNTADNHEIYVKWTGGEIQLLTPSERYGYTFEGWYETADFAGTMHTEGESYSPTKNITLYAKWRQDKSTLTIDANGGTYTGDVTQEQYVGTTLKIADPIRTGYTFEGWEVTDGNGTISSQNFTFGKENTLLKAKWKIITYTIQYTLNGGTATNPMTYTIETDTFTLTNPIKDAYDFIGWTGTDLDVATQEVTIEKGSMGDRTYTAIFDKTTTVKYAVQIYGINQDVDENDNILGLTFGPATGANYNNAYVTHEYEETSSGSGIYNVKIITHTVASDGSETTATEYLKNSEGENVTRTTAEKNKYDVNMHNMTWEEIKAVEDKTVFADCMLCGDTKSVTLKLNSTIGSGLAYDQYGDGAGALGGTIADDYKRWNLYKYTEHKYSGGIYGSNARNEGGYSRSHIRATLIGKDVSNPGYYAGDKNLDASTCLYSCIERDLRDVIIAKKVKYVTGTSSTNYQCNSDISDKIWLYSAREMYGTGENSGNTAEGLGTDGDGYDKFGNINSKYYLSNYINSTSTENRNIYNENSISSLWLRSTVLNDEKYVYYSAGKRIDKGYISKGNRMINGVYVGILNSYSNTAYDMMCLHFGFCI